MIAVPAVPAVPAGPSVPPPWWRRALSPLDPLVDLLLPVDCAGCARPGTSLCAGCRGVLEVPTTVLDGSPRRAVLDVPAASGPAYREPLTHLVHAWKDGGRRDVAPALARTLARSIAALQLQVTGPRSSGRPLWLVPVPSARPAVRRRGEDVVRHLAALAAKEPGRSPTPAGVVPALRQVRAVADQAGLGVDERRGNVQGAFGVRRSAIRRRAAGGDVVVVDDVLTTGASAGEAVRVLRWAGLSVIGVATVCHTPRWGDNAPNGGCPAQGGLV